MRRQRRRRTALERVGHDHVLKRDVAVVAHGNGVVDQFADRVAAAVIDHHVLDDRDVRLKLVIANRDEIIVGWTGDRNHLVAVTVGIGGLFPYPGRRQQGGFLRIGQHSLEARRQIAQQKHFTDCVARIAEQAVKDEFAVRIGLGVLLVDIEQVVVVVVDIDGEAGEDFVDTLILRAVAIMVVELHPVYLGGEQRVPFGETCIIGGRRAELRIEREEVRRIGVREIADRDVEVIVISALAGTVVIQRQFRIAVGIEIELLEETVCKQECISLVGRIRCSAKLIVCQRGNSIRRIDLHLFKRDLAFVVLVDVEIDLVICLGSTILVEVKVNDRNIAQPEGHGMAVATFGVIA